MKTDNVLLTKKKMKIDKFIWKNQDCLEFSSSLPDASLDLIITSPPYSIKKEYEKEDSLADTLAFQEEMIEESYRLLKPTGNICWQVGTHVSNKGKKRIPWDYLLYDVFKRKGFELRNRIIWTYNHGLHAKHFFSGRYETILWFSKTSDYFFDLDSVRVPQKEPNKKFYKGPKKGMVSSNPLGKNPGDVWEITNIKNGHPEKIDGGHPCQFPLQLTDRVIRSMSPEKGVVFDPFGGTATSIVSAIKNRRIGIGCEIDPAYHKLGLNRLKQADSKISKVSKKKLFEFSFQETIL
jgi:adenine-specific DNA-methyltransferase